MCRERRCSGMSKGPGKSQREVLERLAALDGDGPPRWHSLQGGPESIAGPDRSRSDVESLRRMEAKGRVTRAGWTRAGYQYGAAVIWQITPAGSARLSAPPPGPTQEQRRIARRAELDRELARRRRLVSLFSARYGRGTPRG